MDGYTKQEELLQKLTDMQELFNSQIEINKELTNVSVEIDSLPEMPDSLDSWVDSIPDINSENFKLSDYKKMFKMNKKYGDLIEKREHNSQKIKILVIDNIIDKIKALLYK